MSLARQKSEPVCERCGRCLSVCPVYKELRVETVSPRGRLDLIRAVKNQEFPPGQRYRSSIHSCLQCLGCTDACPKGVDAAGSIRAEKTRMAAQSKEAGLKLETWGLNLALGHRTFLSRAARILGRFLPSSRSVSEDDGPGPAIRHLPLFLPQALAGRPLPELCLRQRADQWPETIEPPASRTVQGEVFLFTGCFFGFLDTRPLAAAIKVLGENGIRIRMPRSQACCGAPASLSGHEGLLEKSARRNLAALDGEIPVLTLCATCGNTLKNEYPARFAHDPLHRRLSDRLSQRVCDITEYMAGREHLVLGPVPLNRRAAVHLPCHLNRGMHAGPWLAVFLNRLPGLDILPLDGADECCGGGGLCALKNPELSANLGRKKARAILESRPDLVAAPCPGCLVQIRAHLGMSGSRKGPGNRVRAVHPLELAARTWEN
jgi:glycolate oxidase iron-sulfur subunit